MIGFTDLTSVYLIVRNSRPGIRCQGGRSRKTKGLLPLWRTAAKEKLRRNVAPSEMLVIIRFAFQGIKPIQQFSNLSRQSRNVALPAK
jgi:hypothetical protein